MMPDDLFMKSGTYRLTYASRDFQERLSGSNMTISPGQRVLLVEDEPEIVELISDMLEDLSCQVVATASSVDEAVALALRTDVDLAILDVRLKGQPSEPVARILQDRGIPFIFATGYRTSEIDREFEAVPTLSKPFRSADLSHAMRLALERSP